MSTVLHCNEVCRGKSACRHIILEWLASNAPDTKTSDPWRFINWILFSSHVHLPICMSFISDWQMKERQIISAWSSLFFKKERKERENKQLKVASGIISLRGIEPLKAKTSIKEGRKKRSAGTANNVVTQPTHPLLTLLSHRIVKITVRSASCLRTAGENVGLCGRCCVLTILRTIKKETIWHNSSI